MVLLKNTVRNLAVQVSFWVLVFKYFEHIPRTGNAGSYGNTIFKFLKYVILSFTVGALIYIPTHSAQLWWIILDIFSWSYWMLIYLFWKKKNVPIQVFCLFTHWVIICYWVVKIILYILDSNSLSDRYLFPAIVWVSFSSFWLCSMIHRDFKFWYNPIYLCFLLLPLFLVSVEKNWLV